MYTKVSGRETHSFQADEFSGEIVIVWSVESSSKGTGFWMTTSFSQSRRMRFFAPNHLKKTRISRRTKLLSGFKLVQNILLTTLEMVLIPQRNMILRKKKQAKENETALK